MLKTVMLAAVALSVLAVSAPAAHAEPAADCDFRSLQQPNVTGQTWEGFAVGYAVNPGVNVGVRCYVDVNGVEVSTTAAGHGNNAAATYGRISYSAGDVDTVRFCTVYYDNHAEARRHCVDSAGLQLPPQAVIDLAVEARRLLVETLAPVICPVVGRAGGTYGSIFVSASGDIYVFGPWSSGWELLFSCWDSWLGFP